MSTSSSISESSSTALVLSSATIHPPIRPTSLNRNSNCWNTNSKIIKIVLMILLGIAYGSLAISLEFSWPAVVLLTAMGVGFIPFVEYLVYLKHGQNQRTSRAPEMSINEALAFLDVPQENANDIEFIKTKYETLKKAVTPTRNFGQSQMGLGIAELLQKIETAYTLLRAQASSI